MYINVQNNEQNRRAHLKQVPFTEFRRKATTFFNAVEQGESILILRHGRPIAEVVPVTAAKTSFSWKVPGLKLEVEGASLSREVLRERKRGRR
jgi:prevent-host-death family protein